MTINRIFVGFDHRQPVSYSVLQHSILVRSSKPVAITPLVLPQLPLERVGLTPFTYSRFLVPWLCDFDGTALFLDSDMVVRGDITELFDQADDALAAKVVKNVRQFEWPSLILWNCGHEANQKLTPDYVGSAKLFDWDWLGGAASPWLGELPADWNHLAGYDEPMELAKLVHYTMGIPAFPETADSPHRDAWMVEAQSMNSAVPWVQLMGNSVHATHLPDGRVLPHFHKDAVAHNAPEVEDQSLVADIVAAD